MIRKMSNPSRLVQRLVKLHPKLEAPDAAKAGPAGFAEVRL